MPRQKPAVYWILPFGYPGPRNDWTVKVKAQKRCILESFLHQYLHVTFTMISLSSQNYEVIHRQSFGSKLLRARHFCFLLCQYFCQPSLSFTDTYIFKKKSSSPPVTSLLTVIIDGVYELHQHLAELVVFANSKAQTFSACNA